MKKTFYLFFTLFILIMLIGLLPIHGESELYDNVLRLHVLANSDSYADQELKLKVRDSVISEVGTMVSDCKSFDEAREVLSSEENLAKIKSAAERTVASEGYSYPVSISLGEEDYPRKNYESLCFPSGNYTSLRVCIGDAEGKNWWCVLFPQLCLGAATAKNNEEAFIEAGFTPDQYRIVTETEKPQYEVKFKLLEIIEETIG